MSYVTLNSRVCLLFLSLLFFIPAAGAAPITLTVADAASGTRKDPGTGLCGSVIHYKTQAQPLGTINDAITLLNKPVTDMNILGRKSGIYDTVNFRNAAAASTGDFTLPNDSDVIFPYSNSAAAMPPGDDLNIAMRLRGYLNITNTLAGTTVTFGVNCDDACSLRIGNKTIIPLADERISSRVTRQAIFQDAGLYAIEIVYYQNASAAFLEWSRALSAESEGNQSSPLDTAKYKLIPATDFYSALIGNNPACEECGAAGMTCSTGNFCGDGLCQVCNLPDHCGPTCGVCPAGSRVCSAGQCVQCASSGDCPSGQVCSPGKQCVHCTGNSDCPTGQVCSPDNKCVRCVVGSDCPSDQQCSAANQCVQCTSSAQCPNGQVCNGAGQCTVSCSMGVPCPDKQICNGAEQCVQCLNATDCPMGQTCNATGQCFTACANSTQCPSGQTCNGSGQCIQCVDNGQCAGGQSCNSQGQCAQCITNAQCPSGQSCSSVGHCLECLTSMQCGDNRTCSPTGQCVQCVADAGCSSGLVCNVATNSCEPGSTPTGCTCTYPQANGTMSSSKSVAATISMFALICMLLSLGLRRHARTLRVERGPSRSSS